MKKSPVFYPFLFAIFPILGIYAHNMQELSFTETLVPLAVALGFTLLLLLSSWLVLRDIKKAGILVSIFLVLLFSYGHVLDVIIYWRVSFAYVGGILVGTPTRYLLLIWALLFAYGAYLILRTRRDLHNLTNILNVLAASLVVVILINIGVNEFTRPSSVPEDKIPAYTIDSGGKDTVPDIYYIILDAYASNITLKEFYDFDNVEFLDYLSDKEFYVASQSRCNYISSGPSLVSSLNMEYINDLANKVAETGDKSLLYGVLENNKVQQFLKLKGYRYIHVGSKWDMTRTNRYADINFSPTRYSDFQRLLWSTTMLRVIPSIPHVPITHNYRLVQWETALYQFEKLAEVPDMKESIKGPIFVFAHVVIPHIPHVFDRDGRFLPQKEEASKISESYVDQLIFCNGKLKTLIDEILSKSEVSPIIILQGDHGPASAALTNYFSLSNEDQIRVTMRQLNAYHLPQGAGDLLYDNITPVNTFRLIFNYYFDTNYELLDDRSYWPSGKAPKYYVDVTDIVKYEAP